MRTYINHTLKLVMGLGLIAGLSGCDKDRGPSVEDHFLNYPECRTNGRLPGRCILLSKRKFG